MTTATSTPHHGADILGACGDERDPGTEFRGARLAGELLLAVALACAVSLMLQWIVTRMNVSEPSYVPLAVLSLSSAVLLGVAVWLVSKRAWPRWASPLSWAGLAALGTLPLALSLQNTPFYLHGVSQDQFFRTQYLQRLTESIWLADGNYLDMPPFYPAGWFWIGGRFANLLDMPAWAAYKPYAILTMAVAPVIAFVLWSRVTRRPTAVLLSVLTCLVGLRVAAYEPYSWVLVAAMVPVSVLAWREFRQVVAGWSRSWGPTVLTGLFLGACGAVYTLYFGFFAVALVALGATAVGVQYARDRSSRTGLPLRTLLSHARRALGTLAAMALLALPVVLIVWLPFLLRAIESGELPSSAAQHYLPKSSAAFPTPMLEFSVPGALCMLGTVWILVAWRRSELARALGVLVACCYVWYALSTLALGAQTTLLAFRVEPVLRAVLFCAAAFGGLTLVRWVSGRRVVQRALPAETAFAIVALLGMLSMAQSVGDTDGKLNSDSLYDIAYTTYTPSGKPPLGEVNPRDSGAWNDELLAALDEMTTGRPAEHVMLSAYHDVLAYRAYHGFQMVTVHYANPLADYARRRALVKSWAQSSNSEELIQKLNRSPYAAPDVFVFRRSNDGLHVELSRGAFPRVANVQTFDVVFQPKLFDEPHFKSRRVGPFTVVVRG